MPFFAYRCQKNPPMRLFLKSCLVAFWQLLTDPNNKEKEQQWNDTYLKTGKKPV